MSAQNTVQLPSTKSSYPKDKMIKVDIISSIFTPLGRAGGIHGLRYEGLAIANYDCALQCLVHERLQLVQIQVTRPVS